MAHPVAREPRLGAYARAIGEGAAQAAERVQRQQRTVRLVEMESGPDKPLLDFVRSASAP